MTLLTLTDVSLAYGHLPLLDRVQLRLEAGERVCLVGRNGAGKSTLFRVMSGMVAPDSGEVWRRDTLRVSHLLQELPGDDARTVYETVAAGIGELGALLSAFHDAARTLDPAAPQHLRQLGNLQQRIEAADGWRSGTRIETAITRLGLSADATLAQCSGGTRRRVMLAQALVSAPDLLLLDEPTNHLDIAAISWLEEFLLEFPGALVFITHDRTLLRHLATRIIELDRGKLGSWPGSFDLYLRRKDEQLAAEEVAQAKFDKRLAEEERWIRQGVKARRTRNEGRVRRLERMRRERAARVTRPGRVDFEAGGELSGKLVADLRGISFRYGERPIIENLSMRILRGDRVGVMGPNGSGKSTLLRILLGELEPAEGEVVLGSRLEIAYFDQQRAQLDPEKSVRENLSPGSDFVRVRGRARHVVGYLRDFLFPYERVDSPVKTLSGGERNRLLLAALFTRPANMLVLDEPTNDLDVDTLELLEELLSEFDGTLLVVSHDRAFLDNVVTSTVVFEGGGRVTEYVGGYEDWLRQRRADPPPARTPTAAATSTAPRVQSARPAKLGYREQQELAALPATIERLETEQSELLARTAAADFYRQDKASITAALDRLKTIEAELIECYARWEQLEGIAGRRRGEP